MPARCGARPGGIFKLAHVLPGRVRSAGKLVLMRAPGSALLLSLGIATIAW